MYLFDRCAAALVKSVTGSVCDTPELISRKQTVMLTTGMITISSVVLVLGLGGGFVKGFFPFLAIGIVLSSSLIGTAYAVVTKSMPSLVVEAEVLALLAALIVVDMDVRRTANPIGVYPLFFILVDTLLSTHLPTNSANRLVGCIVIWILLMALEQSLKFGLSDLERLFVEVGQEVAICNCEKPPCSLHSTVSATWFVINAGSVLLNYIFVSGCIRGIQREKTRMQVAINIAQRTAMSLSCFNLEEAALILDSETRLPVELHDTLMSLLANLEMYRPYLPKTCLPFAAEGEVKEPMLSCSDMFDIKTQPSPAVDNPLPEEEFKAHDLSRTSSPDLPVPFACKWRTTFISLVTMNLFDSLAKLPDAQQELNLSIAYLVEGALACFPRHKGMVDAVRGDRVFASFNSSRMCPRHASAAAAASLDFVHADSYAKHGHFNVAIVTGKLVTGDLGCRLMRQFGFIGVLPQHLNGVERVGRLFGCTVVCNAACQSDTQHEQAMVLIPRVLHHVKTGGLMLSTDDVYVSRVYEVLVRTKTDHLRKETGSSVQSSGQLSRTLVSTFSQNTDLSQNSAPNSAFASDASEWMYELADSVAKWDAVNKVIWAFLTGRDVSSDVLRWSEESRPLVLLHHPQASPQPLLHYL